MAAGIFIEASCDSNPCHCAEKPPPQQQSSAAKAVTTNTAPSPSRLSDQSKAGPRDAQRQIEKSGVSTHRETAIFRRSKAYGLDTKCRVDERVATSGQRRTNERDGRRSRKSDQDLPAGFDQDAYERNPRTARAVREMPEKQPRCDECDREGGESGPDSPSRAPKRARRRRRSSTEPETAECRPHAGKPYDGKDAPETGVDRTRLRHHPANRHHEEQRRKRHCAGRKCDESKAMPGVKNISGGCSEREGRVHSSPHPRQNPAGIPGTNQCKAPGLRARDDETLARAEQGASRKENCDSDRWCAQEAE